MRINDFEHLIQEIKSRVLSNSDEYISLMRTVGNNMILLANLVSMIRMLEQEPVENLIFGERNLIEL
jgi:hypothetical protein